MDTLKIGTQIAKYRKVRRLTQEALAEALHITPQAVSKWENGLAVPDAATLADIANLLCVSTDDLLRRFDKRENADYEITVMPDKPVAPFSGVQWPHSLANAALLSALKLVMGLGATDDKGQQVNGDEDYILQSGIAWDIESESKDTFAVYGLDYDKYDSAELSQEEKVALVTERINCGYPVIVYPKKYADIILAYGYKGGGNILKGVRFLDGDDRKNSFFNINKPEYFPKAMKEDCSLLLIKPGETMTTKQAMINALRRPRKRSLTAEFGGDSPLFGLGLEYYELWEKALREDAEKGDEILHHTFPQDCIEYEEKLRRSQFLEQCLKEFEGMDTIELSLVCDNSVEAKERAKEILFAVQGGRMQEMMNIAGDTMPDITFGEDSTKAKREAIITALAKIRTHEELINWHIGLFLEKNQQAKI
jgi:transcriptional regulator with XRE-family HTH domain